MGQYYMWVNASKRQYLGDEPFATGLKLMEQCWEDNPMTDAALTLLAGEWAGDLVILVGDYFNRKGCYERPGLEALCDACLDSPYEYAMDHFVDVAGMFASAKGAMRCLREDEYHGQDSSYVPYEGPFDLEPVHFRYVANDTRREFVDRAAYKRSNSPWGRDPFPLLMSSAWGYLNCSDGSEAGGAWIGEAVRPCHEPPTGYSNGTDLYGL